uniref:Regulator of G-protein signaling 7 n=1 Tax=Musca domestica TaxID=7370 RepID=A0A1I8N8B3_MUSDO
MVTMSTEVDKTQATIANAMAQKVENSTTSLNGGVEREDGVEVTTCGGLNNGSLNFAEKVDSEKPTVDHKSPQHDGAQENQKKEDTEVTGGHMAKETELPVANACPAKAKEEDSSNDTPNEDEGTTNCVNTEKEQTETTSCDTKSTTTTTIINNNNNNNNNISSKLETVTTVQITTTTTTETATTPTNTAANQSSDNATDITTPTPTITTTAATPTTSITQNTSPTPNKSNCSSSATATSKSSSSGTSTQQTTAQQQTLLPSSIQINKVNANAPTSSSANAAGSSSGTNASGSHQRNQQQQQQSHHHQGSGGQQPPSSSQHSMQTHSGNVNHSKNKNEDAPNILVYKKMEAIVEKMQAESTGVSVRTVKGFMTKVPSVFTGADLISWILKNLDVEDVTEALHFAHLLASHGYIFPIDDHQLTVKNDGTFYRFQTPYFWPSNCWEPENTDYAVYLCKRTMQNKTRLELADYEAENLAKLQKMFSRKWEFIFMQAESQSKVAKKRDKLERKVLDSQERAFWDVHRPMPGCVNTTEIDIKKAYRRGASSHGTGSGGASVAKNPIELLTRIITLRKQKLERRTIKVSKAAEALVSYYEQYNEFDYFITSPDLPNPWQTDSTEMWDAEKNSKEVSMRRCKRWAFSMRELLKDPMGREQFAKFLGKKYSKNPLFWESVQEMKALPQSEIKETIQRIWQEFLAPDAPKAVNVDSKSVELAREAVNSPNGPNRWCFDVAAAHVYHLMERDSYPRYLRSDMYKDYINCSRKKIKSIPNLFGVKR